MSEQHESSGEEESNPLEDEAREETREESVPGKRQRRRIRRAAAWAGAGVALCLLLWTARSCRHVPSGLKTPVTKGAPAGPQYPDPPGIVLHNSDSPAVYHGIPINAAALERIHAHDHPNWRTEWNGKIYYIGYHYVILPDGTIQQGRPDHCPGTHARKHNNYIGICLIGAFGHRRRWWPSEPTPEQLKSVLSLCEKLMSKYHIPPEMVVRHRDVNQTDCPGERFPYGHIQTALKAYATLHPETRPLPGSIQPSIRAASVAAMPPVRVQP